MTEICAEIHLALDVATIISRATSSLCQIPGPTGWLVPGSTVLPDVQAQLGSDCLCPIKTQ